MRLVKMFCCSILIMFLLTLSSCGLVHVYKEPEDGSKARMRVVYGGAAFKFYPGGICTKSEADSYGQVSRWFANFRSNKDVGIPLKPEKGWYDEFFIRSGVPFTVTANYGYDLYVEQHKCNPLDFTFFPLKDADYETEFVLIKHGKQKFCILSLSQIIKNDDGTYKKETMKPNIGYKCE
ncbi:MAG: hypothetical protein JXR79_09175 [Nitrospirae bacterium]|nr:hypothetical protein [Nitrospirota bacterium]